MASQKDLIAYYRDELKRSKRWRGGTDAGYDEDWRRYIDMYQGKQYDAKNDVDQLTVNLVFATINVMAPAVAINNPRFVVNARNPESAPQAILTEEVLNYLWRANQFQREFRLAVLDWLLIGHGWCKVGFKSVKEPEVKKPTDWDQLDGAQMAANEGIDDRDDTEGNVESEMIQETDRPFLERISPFDMFVDPDARHPKEMRWVAQRVWRPEADVRVDDRYSATNRSKVTATTWSRWTDAEAGDARVGSDTRLETNRPDRGQSGFVEVIEFYDLKRKTVSTFAYHGGEEEDSGFLIKPKGMPYASGHPFVMLRNYEVPDHFYPLGDVAQIESLQLELNETRNQMMNYRKKFRRAWLYSKDLIDRDGVQALESDIDNVMVPVMGDVNPAQAISPMPVAITPPEFWDQSALISNDLDRVSGVSDYQRGGQEQNIRRTATEAAMIQDAANARAQDRLAKIESIMAELAERVIMLMQQYLTGEHVARIVTIPVRGWINYSRDHLLGSFDFEVMGGSTEPRNESFRRQSALQLVDASLPFMEQGVVNVPSLYAKLLQDGFGVKDPSRFVELPPPPGQMMQDQMPPDQMPPGGQPPMPGPQGPMPPDFPMQMDPEMFSQLMMAEQGGLPQMP